MFWVILMSGWHGKVSRSSSDQDKKTTNRLKMAQQLSISVEFQCQEAACCERVVRATRRPSSIFSTLLIKQYCHLEILTHSGMTVTVCYGNKA